jgi:hypothetical protein
MDAGPSLPPSAGVSSVRLISLRKSAPTTSSTWERETACYCPRWRRNYRRVLALDIDQKFVERSRRLIDLLKLDNVEALCVRDVPFPELRKRLGSGFRLMFLLETLEHAGSQPDLWGSKMDFLRDCFSLLEENGRIVVSVPKMVGLVMLFKNTLQRSLGLGYDRMSFRQLLRSSLLKKTDDLEPMWSGDHVGFNHRKLDKHLARHFVVHHRSESLISVFYVLGRKSGSA